MSEQHHNVWAVEATRHRNKKDLSIRAVESGKILSGLALAVFVNVSDTSYIFKQKAQDLELTCFVVPEKRNLKPNKKNAYFK